MIKNPRRSGRFVSGCVSNMSSDLLMHSNRQRENTTRLRSTTGNDSELRVNLPPQSMQLLEMSNLRFAQGKRVWDLWIFPRFVVDVVKNNNVVE